MTCSRGGNVTAISWTRPERRVVGIYFVDSLVPWVRKCNQIGVKRRFIYPGRYVYIFFCWFSLRLSVIVRPFPLIIMHYVMAFIPGYVSALAVTGFIPHWSVTSYYSKLSPCVLHIAPNPRPPIFFFCWAETAHGEAQPPDRFVSEWSAGVWKVSVLCCLRRIY